MKRLKVISIQKAIILMGIVLLARFILFGLVVLFMKYFRQLLPGNGYLNYFLISCLIIDLAAIIFAVHWFKIDIVEQLRRVRLFLIFLFCLLTMFIFLLILPLVNPLDFFEKLSNNLLTVHQQNFTIFTNPDFANIFYFLLMGFIIPIVEEILYRGIIFNLFLKRYSVIISLLMSSLIFAFFHLKFAGIGYLFLYGLLFGYAYYRTKSLVTPILIHVLINLMAQMTKHQYFELNDITLPKYFLFLIICIVGTFIVFSTLNKGVNAMKFGSNLRESVRKFRI